MVNIYSWNGENKVLCIKVIEAVLEPVVGDVRLYVPHKKNAEPKPDGDFQIYIWSSPNGEAVQEVPEEDFWRSCFLQRTSRLRLRGKAKPSWTIAML